MIDAHIHILPELDDGSDGVETSKAMLELLQKQGVDRMIATPHFYAHRESSVAAFLEKREKAYQKLGAPKQMLLGAEVAVEHGISKLPDLEKLAIQHSDLILLEFPYTGFAPWMEEEIYDISVTHHLKPVLAHVHRYLGFYSKKDMDQVLRMKVLFQVNNEAFASFWEHRFVKKLIADGYPIVFGSDSHNLSNRKPNWDLLTKKVRQPVIEQAMELLEQHLQK